MDDELAVKIEDAWVRAWVMCMGVNPPSRHRMLDLFITFCYTQLKGGDLSSLSNDELDNAVFETIPKFVEALVLGEIK
jgi:hypothetical protein|tara:strand:+ start:70 stop:303 length:234 start_codon:yes stop_codon:yes gene_type:complete